MRHVGLRSNAKDIAAQEQLSAGLKNLLINGNLAINQRAYVSGTATISANQYTLDRWRVVSSGQNLAFSAAGNGNQVTTPAGGVEQVIEGANIGGGTYVLSWQGTAVATVNGTTVSNGGTFTLPANTNAVVRFSGGTVSRAQLEPGSIATQFEPRHYGLELSLCQRYFFSTNLPTTRYGRDVAAGRASSVWLDFPVSMRSIPTLVSGSTASSVGLTTTFISTNSVNIVAVNSIGDMAALGGLVALNAEL